MFFNRSTFKASFIAIAVSTGSILADDIVNADFTNSITSTSELFSRRVTDNETTLIKIQGLRLNGVEIPLSAIWTNELINELGTMFREVAIQPANYQQLVGQPSTREWEDEYMLVGTVTSGVEEVYFSIQLVDLERESVVAAQNVTLPRTAELLPLLAAPNASGGIADFYEPDGESSPNVLIIGTVAEGHSISEDDEDWYSYTAGDNPEQITVYTSSDFDTYISVFGPNSTYETVTSNDDGGDGSNARASFITEPNATYYVKVRGYSESSTGSYQLHSSTIEYELPADEPNNSTEQAINIGMDEVYESSLLPANDEDWFRIEGDGSARQITVFTSSDMDTYLHAYGPEGAYDEIGTNDDGGEGSNARLTFIVNGEDTYYVKVRGYDSDDTGAYSLNISSIEYELPEDEPNNSQSDAYEIDFDEDYTSSLMPANDVDFFSVDIPSNVDASSMITFQLQSDMDTKIALYDENGSYIGENDDSGIGENGLISVPVGSHSSFIVKVFPYDDDQGSYTLTQEIAEPVAVEFGTVYSGNLSSTSSSELVRLELPSSLDGSRITIETESNLDTKIALYDANGEALVDDDDSGMDSNASVSWSVSGGEVFFVEVTPYGSDDYGSFRLVHTVR